MRKFTTFFCLTLLILVFAFMFVFCVFMPRVTESNYSILKEWPEFSFETFFSGEYISDVMYCFTDTIHNRDSFIDYEAKISSLYGIEEEEKIITIKPDGDVSESEDSSENNVESSDIESSIPDAEASDNPSGPPESSFIPDESVPEVSNESSQEQEGDQLAEISGSIALWKFITEPNQAQSNMRKFLMNSLKASILR